MSNLLFSGDVIDTFPILTFISTHPPVFPRGTIITISQTSVAPKWFQTIRRVIMTRWSPTESASANFICGLIRRWWNVTARASLRWQSHRSKGPRMGRRVRPRDQLPRRATANHCWRGPDCLGSSGSESGPGT